MTKKKDGDPLKFSSQEWNCHEDAANAHKLSRLNQGSKGKKQPYPTDIIRLKNETGAARRRGEVLEIGDFIYDVVRQSHHLFEGLTPAENSNKTPAILRDPAPDDKFPRAQVAGMVYALVNVTDTSHQRATVADGNHVLQSAESGPFHICAKPTGTGELECKVMFSETGAAAPEGFTVENYTSSSKTVPEHGVVTLYQLHATQTDNLSATYKTRNAAIVGSGAVPLVSYITNDLDDIVEEWVYFVNGNYTIAPGANAKVHTAKDKPRWARLNSQVSNADIDNIYTGQLWGPLPGQTGDEFSLWKGAPGFRIVSGGQEFETQAGGTYYWAAQVVRDDSPFWVVAAENWDLKSGDDEYSVLCNLIEDGDNRPELEERDLYSDNSAIIYDGHDSDHPDIEFRVALPCGKMKHPNIVKGQTFRVQFIHNTDGSTASSAYQLVIASQGYEDQVIGSFLEIIDPADDLSSGVAPQGWAVADGTDNSVGNNGTGVDRRGRFAVGVEDRGSPPSHSDTAYTQGATGGTKSHQHSVGGNITDLDNSDAFDNHTAATDDPTDTVNHVPPWVAVFYLERLDNSESTFTRTTY